MALGFLRNTGMHWTLLEKQFEGVQSLPDEGPHGPLLNKLVTKKKIGWT